MSSVESEDLSKYFVSCDGGELVKQLEEQLQQLDAREFNLPEVTELPTLESILNEPDEEDGHFDSDAESAPDEQSGSPGGSEQRTSSEAETVSVHSRTSSRGSADLLSSGRSRRVGHTGCSTSPDSVVRHISLSGIATQLVSANDRVNAGLPTTMAVGNIICVGTSHGLIMVFEPSQALKWCFESPTNGAEQQGSVSALALSEDGTRLLAGYAKGSLSLFDLVTGNLTQSIGDAHTACTAVLHLKWTDLPNIAMLSDSGGSVFELTVKRTMGLNSNTSRCIFTGSRGEVCTVEPLLMSRFHVAPLLHNVIVAMATITKVIVVSLRPTPKVLFSHPLRAASSSLPLLSWQFVVIQMPDHSRVIDPVLAFGRQNTLYFYQVTHGIGDSLQFLPLRKISTDYLLHNVAWLNPSTIALLDSTEQCHVMDVRSQQVIETLDLTGLGLVYASHHFKGTATGGNVSKAMAVAGERACYHSMVSFGNQVLLLGTKSLQVLTVRSWRERLDQLFDSGKIVVCLQLARQMVAGKAVAVVGLSNRRSKRKAELRDKVSALTQQLLEQWQSRAEQLDSNSIGELVCLCLECGLSELLLHNVWEAVHDFPLQRGVFLEALESFIIGGSVSALPPHISQCLLNHYEQLHLKSGGDRSRLDALEQCIVQLSVSSLDLHQTMTLCWTYGLYDAIIYVQTRGMKDYVTPLQELLKVLSDALDSSVALDNRIVCLGNKLLVYVSGCLAGRGYPHGNIDADVIQQVKYEVFKCLTSAHSKHADDMQKPFPHLRTLLRFDTREFLNVLSLAFEEPEFTTELGLLQRQRLIDILVQVMAESPEVFDKVAVCSLYTFIARQLARSGGSRAAARDTKLIDKVVEELCKEEVTSQREERQTALLELLQDGALRHIDLEHLLLLARRALFWRLCEHIYASRGQQDMILECYLNDPTRQHQVLPYLQHAVTLHQHLHNQLLKHFPALVGLDAPGVVGLLLDTASLRPLVSQLILSLDSQPHLQYSALSAAHAHRSGSRKASHLPSELQERLLRLMCDLESPDIVLQHLTAFASEYCTDSALQIIRKFPSLRECEAVLMLRMGHLHEAMVIYNELLAQLLRKLQTWTSSSDEDSPKHLLHCFQTKVQQVANIIESHCRDISDEAERQQLWLPLLDLLIHPLPASHCDISAGIAESCGAVVSVMLGQVAPPVILERVLSESSTCSPEHVLPLLTSLVSRYRYERRVYTAMTGAVRAEQLLCLATKRAHRMAPVPVCSTYCSVCGGMYRRTAGSELISVFRCGHSYHQSCGQSAVSCPDPPTPTTTEEENSFPLVRRGCVVCHSAPSLELGTVRRPARRLDQAEDKGDVASEERVEELTAAQRGALSKVYELGLTGCRVALLEQLTHRTPEPDLTRWLSKEFPLRLAPPHFDHLYEDL